MKSNAYIFPVI